MRTDEYLNPCPSTLGEYRDMCAAIGDPDCPALKYLDEKIAAQGRDALVLAPDSQVRALLMPMLLPPQ